MDSSAGDPSKKISDRSREALTILSEAADLARSWFERRDFDIQTKQDGTPVTMADRDVEKLLRQRLTARFPDDGVLGEEFPETESVSGNRWIIDPIDGTKSFVHGVPLYATLLAYQEPEGITFGAIALPSLSQTIYAETGNGCWLNGQRVGVSHQGDLSGAYVMATWLEDWDAEVLHSIQQAGVIIRTWGDAYGYFLVATGRADAVVDHTVQIYDIAPMVPIIEEAGGRFTDSKGAKNIDNGDGVASNGLIHDALLRALWERRAHV